MAELFCQRCGIQLERGNVIELLGRREVLCRQCESAQAEQKWIVVILVVAVLLLVGGAVMEWLH